MSAPGYIPFNRPEIGDEEIAEVVEVLRSGWLTTGERTHRFEREFRAYTGARHALALSSGTAAIHIALAALGIGPGDEVITTPITFCATVSSILHQGATPVLADVDAHGNLDPRSVAERITPRTKALLPVHLGGMPCRMDALWALARKHGLAVVEDAAHAVGTHYKGEHLGSASSSLSDAVAYSFYATKNITTGEGGMVTTNQPGLAERMRVLALHGINKDAWNRYAEKGNWYYQVLEPGFKYNLSDLQSALGIHQLRRLESFIARRAALAARFNELLGGMDELELPAGCDYGRHAWHLYILRLNPKELSIGRDEFMEELRGRGIGASVHFIPIQLHPFFAPWAGAPQNHCPRSLELYGRMLSLPLYPGMTEEEVLRVAGAVREIAGGARKQTFRTAGSVVE